MLVKSYSTDAGKVILYTRHNTFCIFYPLIPKFRVQNTRRIYQNMSLLPKIAITESPISTKFDWWMTLRWLHVF